jgi:hypothetical protein
VAKKCLQNIQLYYKNENIKIMKNVQQWLNENHPTAERTNTSRILIIFTEPLEGHLDLRDFVNLEFWELGITGLDVSQCPKLTRIFCPRNLFNSCSSQLETNLRSKFRQEFRSVGGNATMAPDQVIDGWFNFSFDHAYLVNPLIVQLNYRLFPADKDNLLSYLQHLPTETEIAFGKVGDTEKSVHVLWHGFQVRNLPVSLEIQWDQQTINNVGQLQQAFFGDNQNENLQRTNSASQNLIRDLQQQASNLQLSFNQRTNEIQELKEELAKSQAKILNFKVEKLEVFTEQLGINWEQIRNLRNAYEQLIHFRRQEYNQANIDEVRNNIDTIEQTFLDAGISLANAQKVGRKCEKIAVLKLKLNQVHQEQFEARQGFPPRNQN